MIRLTLILLLLCRISFAQNNSNPILSEPSDSINLYAFIGHKISIIEYDPNAISEFQKLMEIDSLTGDTIHKKSYVMDHAYNAKYEVDQYVYNTLDTSIIDFKVFDHQGKPAFEKHPSVMLYISRSEDGRYLFHQKNLYDPVHKNRKGVWVGEKGKSIKKIFYSRKNELLKNRGVFKE